MIASITLAASDLWLIAGWTMLHFLWLGALIGAAAAVCRLLLRRASANVRYVAAVCCLVLLAGMPCGIAVWLCKYSPPLKVADSPWRGGARGGIVGNPHPGAVANQQAATKDATIIELHDRSTQNATSNQTVENNTVATSHGDAPAAEPSPSPSLTGRGISFVALESCVPYLPWLWIVGAPITFGLLLSGVVGTRRLGQASRPIIDGPIHELLVRLAGSLRVGKRITVAVCERIAAPVLIGIVRPIILLPPAALTGWSPDEIEMVLLHELAHVRRWDNLANLLQRLVESSLFFHPAVWLVSSWVRRERESCCDAAVVGHTNRPHAYAELLVALAAQLSKLSEPGRPRPRLSPTLHSAMAAGPLRSRIRRILQLEDDPMLVSGKSFALMFGGFLVAATIAVLYLPTIGQAEQSATEGTESTESSHGIGESNSNDKSEAPSPSEFPNTILFERGASRFSEGDEITVLEVRSKAKTFEPANSYWIRGTYTLRSHDRAQLSAFTTAKDSANGTGPIHKSQTKLVNRGNGTFTLILPMTSRGWPHISFYPADGGDDFGGTYFGQGDSVLRKWWGSDKSRDEEAKQAEVSTPEPVLIPFNFVLKRDKSGQTRLYMNDQPVADDVVRDTFTNAAKSIDKLQVSLSAEKGVDHAEEMRVVNLLESLGVKKLAFNPHSEANPAEREQNAEDDWPAGYVFAARKDAEISAGIWQRLQLKLVPATPEELKVAGASQGVRVLNAFPEQLVPNGKQPFILTKVNDVSLKSFEDLNKIHMKLNSSSDHFVTCTLMSDGKTIDLRRERNEALQPKTAGELGNWPTATERATPSVASSKFPTLEDQKLADLAWKRLNLELEPLGDDDSKRVKALGYDGGVKVVSGSTGQQRPNEVAVQTSDILLALHVWPTRSVKDVVEVLNRDDLAELNPLKFYVVRADGGFGGPEPDRVVTGRVSVQISGGFGGGGQSPGQPTSQPNQPYGSTDIKPRPVVANSAAPLATPPGLAVNPFSASAAPVATSTTQPDKSNLRYDGKSFDEWRGEWKTELSTEKRLEAVKALSAFGRAGYGKEAAETILDVAGEYDFSVLEGDQTPEGKLKQIVLDELRPDFRTPSLAPYWVPDLTSRLQKDRKKWQSLAENLFYSLYTDDEATLTILKSQASSGDAQLSGLALGALIRCSQFGTGTSQIDDKTRKLVDEALQSKDPVTVRFALSLFVSSPPTGGGFGGGGVSSPQTPLLYRPAILPELLFHADENVRRQARNILHLLDKKDAQQVIDQLVVVLTDKSRERDHVEAIRALGAIGLQGETAVAQLEKVLGDREQDLALRVAAGFAIDRIEGGTRCDNILINHVNDEQDEKVKTRLNRLINEERQIQ